MNDIKIKVSTDVLLNQAEEIRAAADSTKQLFDNIEQIVNGSKSYWEGEAQNRHLEAIKTLKPEYTEISKLLSARTDKLLKIAGLYNEGEKAAAAAGQSLPSGIIV